jgi:undecaprenyl-phosphate 4-deoxy-4-formamido-L-arabinose transferase
MRHHHALDVRSEQDGDRTSRALPRLDERARFLEHLLVAAPSRKDSPERPGDRSHRGPRLDEPAADLDRILAELDRLAHRLDGLNREPARAVGVVVGDLRHSLRQLLVHPPPSQPEPRPGYPQCADGSLLRMAEIETIPASKPDPAVAGTPSVSLVVPVYNEERTVEEVYRQSVAALGSMGRSYEIIFVDDGSSDGTWRTLQRLHESDADLRAVRLKRNFGQHPAMHAGLVRARGDVVLTMDGDLQNSPADLPKLVAAVEAGADVASGRRPVRQDSWGRTLPSKLINGMLRRFTSADISDFGCAFNAYSRDALTPVLGVIGKQKFTKALVLSAGASVVEVELEHRAREGSSRYSPLRLTRLALHVLAGFWPQPIQWAGVLLGTLCGTLAAVVGIWATVVWIVRGNFPGMLYLGGLVLGVLAVQGFILALVGEYLGRIQRDVEGRPLYTIDSELG